MPTERSCSITASVEGQQLGQLRSGMAQFDVVAEPPPTLPPDVAHNVLILYGGVISYTAPVT